MRLTLHVDEQLKKQFHTACIANSETMSERVTKLIEKWLEEQAKQHKGGKK